MKALAWIVASIVFVLFSAAYLKHVSDQTAMATAYIDWKPISDDTFVLDPGQIRVGYQTPDPTETRRYGFRPKMTIHAGSPVTVGFIPAQYRSALISNPASLNNLPIFYCLDQHVLQTTVDCENLNTLNQSYVLYIKDERTTGQIAGSTLLSGIGIKGPAEQALARNDVRVEFSAYTCVRNCQQQ